MHMDAGDNAFEGEEDETLRSMQLHTNLHEPHKARGVFGSLLRRLTHWIQPLLIFYLVRGRHDMTRERRQFGLVL